MENFSRILGREGANPRTSRIFYKAVIQVTLLFGSETWVMNPIIRKTLGIFHHKVACGLVGMQPQRDMMGRWA